MTPVAVTTTEAPLELVLNRRFDAPRSLVFGAWTNPETPVGWWGPKGFTLEFDEKDLRIGGRWRLGMRAPDGTVHVNGGVYREIVAPERLVMTHGWEGQDGRLANETLVTITLTEQDGGTEMVFEQTGFDSAGSRDGHGQGWGEAFDALGEALASAR